MDQLADFRLYLVTDRWQTGARPLIDVVEECLAAGLMAVQLREKDLSPPAFTELAGALRGLTRQVGARLFINGRADVAVAVGADGVQRGHDALPTPALRLLVGSRMLIGVSVHSVGEAEEAERDGADFVVFGPVHDTPSKRAYGPPQGVEALREVVRAVALPIFAIGGITPERVAAVRAAGAWGVGVISAILGAERPGQATKAFLDALEVQ